MFLRGWEFVRAVNLKVKYAVWNFDNVKGITCFFPLRKQVVLGKKQKKKKKTHLCKMWLLGVEVLYVIQHNI